MNAPRRAGPGDSDPESDSVVVEPPPPGAALAPPKPRPPFAPFMMRLAAFVIDCVAIYFVGYTLEMAARAPLMRLGPFLPFLSSLAAFAYFWLGNGPVGNGATFGKALLNLRVVDAQGKTLGLGASLRRALLQMPLACWAVFVLAGDLLPLPPLYTFAVMQVILSACLAVMLTLSYGAITQVRRQGWHDQWAGSYVTPDPPSLEFREATASSSNPDANDLKRGRIHFAASLIFCVLVASLLGAPPLYMFAKKESRDQLGRIHAVSRDLPVPNYRLDFVRLPQPDDAERFADAVRFMRANPPQGQDAPTTDTLRKQALGDGQTVFFQYTKVWGEISPLEFENAELKAAIERLRLGWAPAMEKEGLLPPNAKALATRFFARFVDPFRFAVFPFKEDHLWYADGPSDPAAGPLVFEMFTPPAEKPRH